MYVGWNMKMNLVTVTPETPVFKARELMDTHRVSHLPVTDGKAHLVGMITDRDLKEAWASPATTLSVHELTYVLQKLTVANIMTRDLATASPDTTIERAAQILHDRKIGALPVLKDRRLVGILTTTDLMEVLLLGLGMTDDSRRFTLLVKDRTAALARVGSVMHEAGIVVLSTMAVPLKGHPEVWQLLVRVTSSAIGKATEAMQDAGLKVITEYVEDLSSYMPR